MSVARILALFTLTISIAFADAPAPQTIDVPMHDGASLKTDVYKPATGGPAFPVILVRLPYPRESVKGMAEGLFERGYALVVQSSRGTGDSGGTFTGFTDDGWSGNTDGKDAVDWILAQPWCNGKIGTVGGSAGANTQMLLAGATDKVTCQEMEAGACDFYKDLAYPGGVWRTEQTDVWLAMFKEPGEGARKLFRAHPTYDDFWQGMNVESKAPAITAPAFHIGGWFDIFKEGTIRAFTSRQYNGGPGAKGNQKLIMKWSGHGEYKKDLSLKFPENVFDLKVSKQIDGFLDHWMLGAPAPDTPAVQYYVIGDDTDKDAPGMEWRTANRWPPFPPLEKTFYLYGDLLTEVPPENVVARAYTYDPANPCPTTGGCNLTIPFGPYNQRPLFGRKDVLLYQSAALLNPLETTGDIKLKLFVSSTAPDTDFTAKLMDIYPDKDERAILVVESIQRIKFRNGLDKPAPPLNRDEVVELTIDLGNTSWIFNKGHKLAVLVSSSNSPHFEPNPNTGEDMYVAGKSQTADNTLYASAKRPSALTIPVRDPERDTDKDGVTDEAEWDKFTDLNDPNSK